MHFLRSCLAAVVLFAGLLSVAEAANRTPAVTDEATPPQIQQLLTLLADPKVQAWLKQQNEAKSGVASRQDIEEESVSHALDSRLGAIREHILALARTIPDLPNQFGQGARPRYRRPRRTWEGQGPAASRCFCRFGRGCRMAVPQGNGEGSAATSTRSLRKPLKTACISSPCVLPLRSVWSRLLPLAASAPFSRSIGRRCCARCCSAISSLFLSSGSRCVVGHFLLAPHHERFRIIPMDTMAARFWHRRLVVFVGWFAFGWVMSGCSPLSAGHWQDASSSPMCSASASSRSRWKRFGAGRLRPARHAEAPSTVTRRFGRRRAQRAHVGRHRRCYGCSG